MKIGNQPIPVSARLAGPSYRSRARPAAAETNEPGRADRVEISTRAMDAQAAARLGVATGLTPEQVRDLVASSNREASRTAAHVDLNKIRALMG